MHFAEGIATPKALEASERTFTSGISYRHTEAEWLKFAIHG